MFYFGEGSRGQGEVEPLASGFPARRVVYQEDAVAWLESRPQFSGVSFITSLPDLSEFPARNVDEWSTWFVDVVCLILARCPDEGVSIFYQTDLKHQGTWIDKGYLCQKGAEKMGHAMISHKIVCRVPAGNTSFGRPAYSHLLCFSRGVRADLAKSTMDVLPQAGEVTWTRGMGVQACLAACRFVLSQTSTRTVIDPFCGHGTVLAIANELGLEAIGVERGAKRARRARKLRSCGFQLFTAGATGSTTTCN